MKKWKTLAFAVALTTTACGGSSDNSASAETNGAQAETHTTSGSENTLPEAPRVSGAEAQALVAEGAVLLDVTPPPYNAESALEGRVNIPVTELADRLDELPRDRTIVVYCKGGGASPRAGAMLQAEGFDARVMGAMTEWPSETAGAE